MPDSTIPETPPRVKMTLEEKKQRACIRAKAWALANPERIRQRKIAKKELIAAQMREWREKNKAHILNYASAYKAANEENIRKMKKRHYDVNRQRILQKSKEWACKNKEIVAAGQRRWMQKNKAILNAKRNAKRALNRQKRNEVERKWREKNHENHILVKRKWCQSESGQASGKNSAHKRRAKILNSPAPATKDQIQNLLASAKRCHYCEMPFNKTRRPNLDHIIPLDKDGPHSIDNLCAACKHCNSRKSAKHPHDFAREIGRLLI